MQWLGIVIVFAGIMMEIVNNYNLASKILPNHNVRSKEGENYNKIVPKDEKEEEFTNRYDANICDGVEGIWWFIGQYDGTWLLSLNNHTNILPLASKGWPWQQSRLSRR